MSIGHFWFIQPLVVYAIVCHFVYEMEARAMVTRKKTDTIQLSKIRMSEDLRRRLAREAQRNGATLNGEIVDRLEASFTIGEITALMDRKIDVTIKVAVETAIQTLATEMRRRENEHGSECKQPDQLGGLPLGER